MYPTLFSIGELHFHSYAIFLSAGFLAVVFLIVRENYRQPNPAPITPIGGLLVFLGGFLGARIYFILQYKGIEYLHEALYLWSGGLVFYGGAIGGFLGGVIYVLFVRAPVLQVADLAISYVPLAHAIARVGCFLNGCCWGSRTDMPWGVQYPQGTIAYKQHLDQGWLDPTAAASLPVHATQLYSTGGLLAIFVLLRLLQKSAHPPGSILLAYLFAYGVHRTIVESFRGDSARHILDMTASQWIGIGMATFAVFMVVLLRATAWKRFLTSANETPQPAGNT